jgi:hypothetical protein
MINSNLPEIVKRALLHTINDIGQLTSSDKSTLNAFVKKGWLSKGKGGPFPVEKTVYAHPGYDFTAARIAYLKEAECLIALDRAAALTRAR